MPRRTNAAPEAGGAHEDRYAPDYVEDEACAACHAALSRSFAGSGMARAFRPSSESEAVEDFSRGPYLHRKSRTTFQIVRREDRLVFRSWQRDADGSPFLGLEIPVDFVLGSGHRARVYVYRAPGGELFQLPLAWYSEERTWGMAPGYDRPDHDGVLRRIRRECLFCHDAFPALPKGADAPWAPQVFPVELPRGIGCQRCHGPGSAHVDAALESLPEADIRKRIVNPSRLERPLRDAVCEQCHLLPATAVPGPRRLDRGDFSFRPGESLSSYLLPVDVEEAGRRPSERFEINHHAYRLSQSPCAVDGRLHCTSCHDPHRPLGADPRLKAVDGVCLGCHEPHPAGELAGADGAARCASCHMPRRRTQDVVHVTMTDHRISRRPPPGNPLAPLEEADPVIRSVRFLRPAEAPSGPAGRAYLAAAVLRAGTGDAGTIERLRGALDAAATTSPAAHLDLVSALLHRRRMAEAETVLSALSPDARRSFPVPGWLGLVRAAQGRTDEAISGLRAAAEASPGVAEIWFNLGLALRGAGRHQEALEPLTRAVELRPTFAGALYQRGAALASLSRRDEAIADLEASLAITPRDARTRAALVRLLEAAGRVGEVRRLKRLPDAPAPSSGETQGRAP